MNFGEAIKAAKEGKKITRRGWNGKGMYVVYRTGYPEGIPCNKNTADALGVAEGTKIVIRPYLQMCCADGTFQMWLASQSDILAEDWEIRAELSPVNTMNVHTELIARVVKVKEEAELEAMTQEREAKILEGAIAKYGAYAQIDHAIEEMSELTKALLKERRAVGTANYDASLRDHILEEMADVYIMLNQLSLIFGDCSDWEVYKLERLERRHGDV